MTLPGLLGAVDRLGRRPLGAAVDNARSSAAAVAGHLRLREQLAPADDDGPGALTRWNSAPAGASSSPAVRPGCTPATWRGCRRTSSPEVWARGPRSSVIAIELTRVEGRRLT